jgi:hypothetical protein
MRKLGAVIAAGVAAFISTSAMAQSAATDSISAGNSELSVNGYAIYKSGTSFGFLGFSYGSFVNDTTLIKLGVNGTLSETTNPVTGASSTDYSLGLRPAVNVYFPSEGSTTVPYITAYAGYTASKSGSDYYGGGVGVGAKFFFNQNTAFGPEVDYEYNKFKGGSWDGQAIFKLELSTYF